MITIDPAELAALEARAGVVARTLLWVEAKNRDTGETETMGLWNGEGTQVFEIEGETRVYRGPALPSISPIRGGVGLVVRQVRMEAANLSDEVQQVLRGYEARLARVEIHHAMFSLETNTLVAAPRRRFKGQVDKAPEIRAETGGTSRAEIILASAARVLTRTLALFKSDADQRARNPNDRFAEYGPSAGLKAVWWGEEELRRGGGGGEGRGRWDRDDRGRDPWT
ncbi:MAG: hypothetical protein HLUCCA12_12205 [Rhodobacteraceae bacterium HLUCCA12]|nr:MAG: hypothetical protein HLUCCA12_12205 [Rhodobacteraceae bacterium HLUCCA12]